MVSHLICPRCAKPLELMQCGPCKTEFPTLGALPCLVPYPEAFIGGWKSRWEQWLSQTQWEINQATEGATREGLVPTTRKRLQHWARTQAEQQSLVQDWLGPLLKHPVPVSELEIIRHSALPLSASFWQYGSNLHRDWAWGEAENKASLNCVRQAMQGPVGNTLVLGTGWGRLAYDVAQTFTDAKVTATDLNPLALYVAHGLCHGRTARFYEIPLAPLGVDEVNVLRELKAPKPLRNEIKFILSDVRHPPFSAQSFDTVLTPWLIDVLPQDFATLATQVNHLLKPQGQWVNFGSIAFERLNPVHRLTREEVVEVVAQYGFEITHSQDEQLPYLASPLSRHQRQEITWTFGARKTQRSQLLGSTPSTAAWIVDPEQPVPTLESFKTALISHKVYFDLLSSIDGKTSLRDLARDFESRYGMTAQMALEAVTHFMATLSETR